MTTISEIVGENIRQEREAVGLSQAELADKLRVDPQSVYRWEKGKAWPTANNVEALAKLFKATPSSLFQEAKAPAKDAKVRDSLATVCRALGFALKP